MKNIILILILLFGTNFCFSQTHHEDYLDGVVYLKVKNDATITLIPYDESDLIFNQLIDDFGIYSILHPFTGIGSDTLDLTYKFHFTDTMGVDNLVSGLNNLPWVDYCEKAPLYKIFYFPNDVHPNQWYLTKINAFTGWDHSIGSESVTIAIIDNAVRTTHQDLINNIWINSGEQENGFDSDLNGYTDDINGYDVADGDNNPNPPPSFTSGAFSHGTHCAGIASATTDNNIGVAGVGFNCKIMSVKCSPDNSDGLTLPYAYEGLQYAIAANADVISMSWGGRVSSFTGEALLNAAFLNGIVMLAAAGNDNEENLLSPASHPNVMAVGATNQQDQRASFSNYGTDIDFMAPGVSIYNTLGGNNSDYGYNSGTSMACPLAAGIAGLLLSEFPSMSPTTIRQAIRDGCDYIDNLNSGYEEKLGAGRVNIGNTFQLLSLDESKAFSSSSVYPNPAQNIAYIKMKDLTFNANDLVIYNIMGKSVSEQIKIYKINEYTFKLDGLSILKKGVYYLNFQNSTQKPLRLMIQ